LALIAGVRWIVDFQVWLTSYLLVRIYSEDLGADAHKRAAGGELDAGLEVERFDESERELGP
jgi:hypothetical protein